MLHEFETEEALNQYESSRREYYIKLNDELRDGKISKFGQLVRSILNKEWRAKKRLYEGYKGGYWKDGDKICIHNIHLIEDCTNFDEGQIAIEKHGDLVTGIYVFRNHTIQVNS